MHAVKTTWIWFCRVSPICDLKSKVQQKGRENHKLTQRKSTFLLVSGWFLIQWLSVPPPTAHDALTAHEYFQYLTVLSTDPTVWTQTELQHKYLKIHFAEKSSWQRTPAFVFIPSDKSFVVILPESFSQKVSQSFYSFLPRNAVNSLICNTQTCVTSN